MIFLSNFNIQYNSLMIKTPITLIFLFLTSHAFGTVFTINNSGLNFIPANITVMDVDTVRFVISNSHDAREVSLASFQSNSNQPMTGGFQTAFGGGYVYPDKLTPGMHYYVCTPHATTGMKGTIEVVGSTGYESLSASIKLLVYPNPAQEVLVLCVPFSLAGTEYRIINAEGRTVLFGVFAGGETGSSDRRITEGILCRCAGMFRPKAG